MEGKYSGDQLHNIHKYRFQTKTQIKQHLENNKAGTYK